MNILHKLTVLMLLFSYLQANEFSRQKYLELISRYPKIVDDKGNYLNGEIQITTDPEMMIQIEKELQRDIGVVHQDKYLIWINDACIFPSGFKGIYSRILWVKALEGYAGVAVMPIMCDGKIALNCNFRHATRSWEIELPRGSVNFGEDCESAARREVLEETGMSVGALTHLGNMPPDTGILTTVVPIYIAKVINRETSLQDETEAIEDILFLSKEEIKEGFIKGYLTYPIKNRLKKINFRDPFLAYALLLYELKSNH